MSFRERILEENNGVMHRDFASTEVYEREQLRELQVPLEEKFPGSISG